MAYQYVLYEKADHIATVTFNRPEVMNALCPPEHDEIYAIFNDIIQDDDVFVVILTGAGDKAFCAGADVKWMSENPEYQRHHTPGYTLFTRQRIWKPIIAAVNGYALGYGMEFALHCDLIIASEHASFGQPEIQRGWTASGGGNINLPRNIPLKIAMWMLLTGDRISAEEAYRVGLVNKVVPHAELMNEAYALARRLCERAPLALQATKEIAMRGLDMPLNFPAVAWDLQDDSPLMKVRLSEDMQEGRQAFVEKRKPEFKGR